MALQSGVVLHNRYRIVKSLAQGGFGAVYKAWDMTLDRHCAIKENLDASPEAQRQFIREAKILAKLTHSNLPRVNDYFFVSGQGQYLVMDFVEGQDLQELIEDRGKPLPENQVLSWNEQISDALSYLHAQNPPIIHRDIKPANIKITPDGKAMLVDFGLAKVYDPNLKTTVGAQAVTPGYSPPEQYGKGATDHRTDVYALGATLFTLLTGQEPPESVQRVARDPISPPRLINPNLTERTSSALMRALQLDPDQRFQNASDLKAALSSPKVYTPPPGAIRQGPPQPQIFPWGWVGIVSVLSIFILVLLILVSRGRGNGVFASPETSPAVLMVLSPSPSLQMPRTMTSFPAIPSIQLTPSLAPQIYTVQPGETCLEIAIRFEVSVDSIVALNDLPSDCGLLYVDQELLIPAADSSLGNVTRTPSISVTPPEPLKTEVAERDGMEQVFVPAGEFLMGSADSDPNAGEDEKPQRMVFLADFWIDRTEVTTGMYARCLQEGACQPPGDVASNMRAAYFDDPNYKNYPVIFVSWEDASAYCAWAGRRLPSEAEWEKAARGLNGQLYPWGDHSPTSQLANFGKYVGDTSLVGYYPAGTSPYGALDMAGNVSEWVMDWYSQDYYAVAPLDDPLGPNTGEFRVLRGGSWFTSARALRAAFRLGNYPDLRSDSIGFRCARTE